MAKCPNLKKQTPSPGESARSRPMSLFHKDKPFLTPDTQAFIDELARRKTPAVNDLSPQDARKLLSQAQANPKKLMPAEIKDLDLKVGPTGTVSTRFVRPESAKGKLPVILYIHGGGWVMGDKHTHERLIRELAQGAQAAVVFPDYTPSPEAQFPVPLDQIDAVFTHVMDNAAQYDLDPTRVAFAGDSVGGNMAAAMTLRVMDRKGPKPCFQLLLYPVTDAAFDTDSYKEFSDGPWLTRDAMKWFWDQYAPDEDKRKDFMASPLRAATERLKGLPPTLIITDENDVLRDEGEAYARKLMQAGVPTACARYLGACHDFLMLDALADTAPARAALRQCCNELRLHLHGAD